MFLRGFCSNCTLIFSLFLLEDDPRGFCSNCTSILQVSLASTGWSSLDVYAAIVILWYRRLRSLESRGVRGRMRYHCMRRWRGCMGSWSFPIFREWRAPSSALSPGVEALLSCNKHVPRSQRHWPNTPSTQPHRLQKPRTSSTRSATRLRMPSQVHQKFHQTTVLMSLHNSIFFDMYDFSSLHNLHKAPVTECIQSRFLGCHSSP